MKNHMKLSILLMLYQVWNSYGELEYQEDPRGAIKVLHGNSVPESGPGYINPSALEALHKIGLAIGIEIPPAYLATNRVVGPSPIGTSTTNQQNANGNTNTKAVGGAAGSPPVGASRFGSSPVGASPVGASPVGASTTNSGVNTAGGNSNTQGIQLNGEQNGGKAGLQSGNAQPQQLAATGTTTEGTNSKLDPSDTKDASTPHKSDETNPQLNSEKEDKDEDKSAVDKEKAPLQETKAKTLKTEDRTKNGQYKGSSKKQSKGGSPGMIFGVLGGLCAIAAVFGIALFYRKRKEQKDHESEESKMESGQPSGFITPKEYMVML